jgi:hypothetical protein
MSSSAALLMAGSTLLAQQTSATRPAERVTMIGCVQSQSAYMQARGTAAVPTAGSNEFVLIDMGRSAKGSASIPADRYGSKPTATAEVPTDAQPGAQQPATVTAGDLRSDTTATAGTSGSLPTAYSLSGHAADLRRLSGKRVEVIGTLSSTAAARAPNLQALAVISVREVPGSCNRR